jgi:hypothetical protein
MKKLLFTAILLISISDIFAFTTQGSWRWRNDDGSEASATWKAAQNAPITISGSAETLRLRIELYNDPANPGGLLDDAYFEVSSDSLSWDTLKTVADKGQPFVLVGTSPNVTDLMATTQQLTSPHAASFAPGKVIVSSTQLPPATVGTGFGTEYEYVFKPTANLKSGATYYFRVDAANYIAANPLPSLKVAGVLSVTLSDFFVKKDGKKAVLRWTTSSEQNNDHFEVERSNNLKEWTTIATTTGNGTSNEVYNYEVYDQSPSNGVNYYRLKQFDLDGRFTLSAVTSLNFFAARGTAVTVSPNPIVDGIHFTINNADANNVSVLLINTNGKTVYREQIKNVSAGRNYKLNMQQKPAPGMYILNLRAEGISENIKIIIP